MGLKRLYKKSGLKKVLRKSVEINKGVFGGGYVKKALKTGLKFAKRNPELVGAAVSVAAPGATPFLGGIFGNEPAPPSSASLVGPEETPGFTSPLPTGLLIVGGAGVLLLLALRK